MDSLARCLSYRPRALAPQPVHWVLLDHRSQATLVHRAARQRGRGETTHLSAKYERLSVVPFALGPAVHALVTPHVNEPA